MNQLYEEHLYSAAVDMALIGQLDCSRGRWGILIDEAQTAIRLTLDELALLAGIVTAETVTHTQAHPPASPGRSAYSLLLEPALFKFPAA